jgi:phosphatidylserine/phosphatidylglycerophosphate/cardiolipin synthase-like enzyme
MTAGLLLESLPCDFARKRNHLHPRLVAVPWYCIRSLRPILRLTLFSELQMRRPNKDRYRLDRLLARKAKEGVMVYIIL